MHVVSLRPLDLNKNGACMPSSGIFPQVTEEREGEGERPYSQVLENTQMRTGRSIDASVLALSISALM